MEFDEYDEINTAVVGAEVERERETDPNLDGTPSNKSGCGGLILRLVIGVFILRAILEIIGLLLK